ncbi:hypothetical protein OAH87_04095 [Marinomonas sp.]|nr:DUF6586 family protein [Marinomonas sp.]MDB4837629.1 hypothetical protein [Marinomonas sp.]
MTNASLASRTNQKLDTARRFIRQSQDGNEQWLSIGLESSAIFQLRSALNGLLNEVSTAYGLSASVDVVVLASEAEVKGITVPVLNELIDLWKKQDSWVYQLEQSYVVQLESRSPLTRAIDSDELIARGDDSGASASFYLVQLVELVLRFREETSEY